MVSKKEIINKLKDWIRYIQEEDKEDFKRIEILIDDKNSKFNLQ